MFESDNSAAEVHEVLGCTYVRGPASEHARGCLQIARRLLARDPGHRRAAKVAANSLNPHSR